MKRDIGALANREHDVLIVGGGIYGAAAAWDAAQRGLQVALVEKVDFGSGASWNSLKTIHGGLRHLQRFEIALLRESVRERRALLRIAPRLVQPLACLAPSYGHGTRGREVMAIGLALNDLLASDRNDGVPETHAIPASRMLSAGEVRERIPGIESRGLTGGALWHDAQASSTERLLFAFLHAAAEAGAVLANGVEVTGIRCEPNGAQHVSARDHEAETDVEIRARRTLLAAGPGIDGILRRAGIVRPRVPLLRAWNLVLSRPAVRGTAIGAKASGRYLFLAPWRGVALLGTEYESAEAPGDPQRLRRFFADAQAAFPWAGLHPEDVALVHAGLVPGKGDADGLWSHSLVVDHGRADGAHGLFSALGAKYTTARAVAEKAVDRLAAGLPRPLAPCRTATRPLPKAAPAEGALEDVVKSAVRDEMALHLSDVVLRRADLGTAAPPASGAVDRVAAVMAAELHWSAERIDAEREGLRLALLTHLPRLQ